MISLPDLLILLREYGLLVALILVLAFLVVQLVRTLLDEDRSDVWRARFYRAAHALLQKREYEKRYISNDVNGRINLARRRFHFGRELLPRSVKVEWVEGGAGQTYDLREGEFVVRLDPANRQETNIVRLVTAVVERTSLVGIRSTIDRPVARAIDLSLVRNVLRELGDRKALDWFFAEEYRPALRVDPLLAEWDGKIHELDERGMFTRILIVELDSFARRVLGLVPRPYMAGEVEGLINFLYRIAAKQLGQDVPLDYAKAHIRIGIILVAATSKILSEGVEPYVRCMSRRLQMNLDAVYVICFDKEMLGEVDPAAQAEFVRLTKSLDAEILRNARVEKDFELRYSCVDSMGRRRDARCVRYAVGSL